ncbi:MAG TPA: type II toxin-antitoxin system MqsA family antitoxin [Ramlibacter sp.]|uniref:type II toxin-antitoxin system MqsA family antitoxin n=1 Tax=Ramlibacter sp. TaxID=1917967 RepID=UPI002C289CDC|nr:type II toxin-antitoxin system MqsA family antitoxin [Ramlibacter sp.]HVZ42843.1 type II toxin-antitoxin system MqsA family antitoxin [Ramlibacter sp.]
MQLSVAKCTNCGAHDVHPTNARSAFWHDDRLVVVEDIPALQCAACGEQYYDDATIVALDLLRGTGFDPEAARRVMAVTVFSLEDALATAPER